MKLKETEFYCVALKKKVRLKADSMGVVILRNKKRKGGVPALVDLAKAHIKSLDKLISNDDKNYYDTFNIGTGKGTSVLELIKKIEVNTNHQHLPKHVKIHLVCVLQYFGN